MAELALPASNAALPESTPGEAVTSPEQNVAAPQRDVAFNPVQDTDASGAVGSPASGQPAASGVGSEYTGVLDYARSRGLDVSGYADDTALMDAMTDRFHRGQQEDYYAQLGRALAPRAAEIQNYLGNSQQRQAAPAAPAAPAEWERPQFDARWTEMVVPAGIPGVYLGKPGTPPAVVEAVNRYAQWNEKYGNDPLSAVRPYLEQQQQQLPQVIQQHVSQALQQFQAQQATQEILTRNAEWMYQADQNGRPQIGVGGQRVMTEQGRRYGQHVQALEQQGMRDPRTVDAYARQLVMAEINAGLAEQYRGQNGNTAPQVQNALASGRPQSNQLQSLTPQRRAVTPGATDPNEQGMSLHQRLTAAMNSAGYTDADFANFHSE